MHTKISEEEFLTFYRIQKNLVSERIESVVSMTCKYLANVKNGEISKSNKFARSFLGQIFKKKIDDFVIPSQFEEFAKEYHSKSRRIWFDECQYRGMGFCRSADWCGVGLLRMICRFAPVNSECYLSKDEYNLLTKPYSQTMLYWHDYTSYDEIDENISALLKYVKFRGMKDNGQIICTIDVGYGEDD